MPIPSPGAPTNVEDRRNILATGHRLGALSVTLGGFEVGTVHASGVNVHLATLDGWWDPPASTGTVEQRASAHGGWTSPAYYGPRPITLVARLRGASWEHVTPVLEELLGAVTLDTLTELWVDEPSGMIRTADVRQDADPLTARSGVAAEVSIPLIAPDPRRYGIDQVVASTGLPSSSGGLRVPARAPLRVEGVVVAGLLVVENAGNMDTSPVFTVHGPCPAFTLTHRGTGRVLRYHQDVPVGRTVVLDVANRTALADGTTPRYVTGSWFDYTPGVNEVAFSAVDHNSDALLVSTHRNAWK